MLTKARGSQFGSGKWENEKQRGNENGVSASGKHFVKINETKSKRY